VNFSFPIFALVILLMGCGREGDAEVLQNLPGKWISTGSNHEITWTVDPSGGYICSIVSHSSEAVPRTNEMVGKFEVRDGVLIDSMTKNSSTNARLPMISPYRIIRSDRRELVIGVETDGRTNEVVFAI
jgi:hypothetical protein